MTGVPIVDARVADHGSVFLVTPTSNRGEDWLEENLGEDATRWGRGYAVEHRFVGDIVEGMLGDGLAVR